MSYLIKLSDFNIELILSTSSSECACELLFKCLLLLRKKSFIPI